MKDLSDQTRAIIAAALSLGIILIWSFVYKPPPPAQNTEPAPVIAPNATATPAPNAAAGASSASGAAAAGAARIQAAPAARPAADSAERPIVVESDLYRVEFSNRGAVVRSWQLKKYTDDNTPPRTLDLVHADAAQQTGWPFSLEIPNAQWQAAANQGLYMVTTPGGAAPSPGASAGELRLTAPAEVDFHWSDGQLDVTKKLKFDRSYVVSIETSVYDGGQPVHHAVAWLGGFGDEAAYRAAVLTTVFSGQAGKVTVLATKNLGDANQRTQFAAQPGAWDSVGIADQFFAAAFIPPVPPGQPVPADLTISTNQTNLQVKQSGSTTPATEAIPGVAAGSTAPDKLDLRAYIGPKDLDGLKAIRPPLNGLVQYGWFGFIAEPLFYVLRWMHQFVPNYGWSIVLLTIGINMGLYPLKVWSWRSMQKMQKVAPEVRAIQDRFKKYSVRDPRKADMNKEVMAVYSREGINPVGSCIPQLAQFPILVGFYRMLGVSIELRHAPWIFWFHDLSGRDPYFVLTIAMSLLMYVTSKMTPMPSTDPSQQRMMAMMPVMMAAMFIFIPVSSGLVLYYFTSQVVAIGQQWHLNRTSPLKALVKGRRNK